jgi:hypothetical protein
MSNYPVDMSVTPEVKAFFDPDTNTISYVVKDPNSTVLCRSSIRFMDFDYAAGRITYGQRRPHDQYILRERAGPRASSGSSRPTSTPTTCRPRPTFRTSSAARSASARTSSWSRTSFGKIFNEGTEFQRDGSPVRRACSRTATRTRSAACTAFAMHTPGHTPACMVHVMGNAAFVGDTLFMPDGGSARADFPGGDAGTLYDSIQKVLTLPDEMRLFMCHDYGPNGRDIQWETTVGDEKAHNIHVGGGKSREDFIKFRTERDAQLAMPRLIIPSLQVNMRAGDIPTDKDGRAMLKVPVNGL